MLGFGWDLFQAQGGYRGLDLLAGFYMKLKPVLKGWRLCRYLREGCVVRINEVNGRRCKIGW